MVQGKYDSVWWSWLCLLRRVYLLQPHDELSSSSISSVRLPHTYIAYAMIPGTVPGFPQDRYEQNNLLYISQWSDHVDFSNNNQREKAKNVPVSDATGLPPWKNINDTYNGRFLFRIFQYRVVYTCSWRRIILYAWAFCCHKVGVSSLVGIAYANIRDT